MAKKKTPASRPKGMSPFRFGLVALVVTVVAVYLAYAQPNPFANPYRFTAVFETTDSLVVGAPVRTAGIPVGTVSKVEPLPGGSGAARVVLEITNEQGLPVHQDAELKIRPRIFLEGNLFVDLSPGSPSSPQLADNGTIPVNQTATPVSLGDVLTSLQGDTRKNLQTLFQEYGRNALGGGGAEGFNTSIKYWEDAYRNISIANGATLGTEPGDLSDVISGQQKVAAALTRNPADLANLVTNFNRFAGALASHESALSAAIPALRDTLSIGRPALQSVNDTLPGVNSFAIAALPAARSSADTIPKAYPFVHQTRLLFGKQELRGLAKELRPTVPDLAKLNPQTVRLLQQNRALSRCQNHTLLPWAFDTDWEDSGVDAGEGGQSGDPPYRLFPRSLEGLSGESRENDANSPVFRVLGLGGAETVINFLEPELTPVFGTNPFKVNAVQPASPLDDKGVLADPPAHRPDVPCEDQKPPNLHATLGKPPITVSSAGEVSGSAPAGAQSDVATLAKARKAEDGTANVAPADAASLAAKLQPKVDKLMSQLGDGQVNKLGEMGIYGTSKLTKDNVAEAVKAGAK